MYGVNTIRHVISNNPFGCVGRGAFLALFLFIGTPAICTANGVVAPAYPFVRPNIAMFLILTVIIVLETWVLWRMLSNRSFMSLLWPVTEANLISTLIGVPIALIYFYLGIPDWEGLLVPISVLVSTTAVAFIVSVYSEYFILKAVLKNEIAASIKKSVWIANIGSYLFFVLAMAILVVQLLWGLYQ